MPYYIEADNPDCAGWATVKEDGEVMGCHDSKQAAINQALAIAQAEGSTFEGERNLDELLEDAPGGGLPDNYRPATSDDVPEGRACGNCVFFNEDKLDAEGRAWCEWWEAYAAGGFYCNAWQGGEARPYQDDEDEDRQVDTTPPQYIQDAAAQGLEFHREGLSGSGVVARTIREATAMAQGNMSEDKVVRASAWAARHRPDLDAEGARPSQDGYPTPGAVAHLLWGIPTGERYSDAVAWFDRKSDQIQADRSVMMVTPVAPRSKGSKAEFRSFEGEIRTDGNGNTFVGYAAKFNVPSEPLPFIERIAPGAFGKSLSQRSKDVRLYINHNSDMVLASKRSGTLRLSEDDTGLRVEADLPDTTAARDLRALMTAGVVSTMSFGFTVPRGGDKWSGDGSERTLTGINLHEVSVVTGFPAYPQTEAAVRSLEKLSERTGMAVEEINDVLDALADGEALDPAKAELLINAIKDATPAPVVEENTANLLALKQQQVGLLAKKW
jgi:HK97 family phage prohead protease